LNEVSFIDALLDPGLKSRVFHNDPGFEGERKRTLALASQEVDPVATKDEKQADLSGKCLIPL
ncbi:Protein of unknown function, partial [Gryllus bimaculatus]